MRRLPALPRLELAVRATSTDLPSTSKNSTAFKSTSKHWKTKPESQQRRIGVLLHIMLGYVWRWQLLVSDNLALRVYPRCWTAGPQPKGPFKTVSCSQSTILVVRSKWVVAAFPKSLSHFSVYMKYWQKLMRVQLLDLEEAFSQQALSAILHLHTCGVVHRDVKALWTHYGGYAQQHPNSRLVHVRPVAHHFAFLCRSIGQLRDTSVISTLHSLLGLPSLACRGAA